ncbi:hypothetical protein JX266_006947 [Neoarthrinium moseri]|uniref:uncharacterized protein n=1 Tax=Neoarthrinium moseri TaxID=1658444 RepID=UPI001FDE9EB1|nr:uncharacterized protein JN550_002794 [Neoarthrinium moseri]KAI1847072.1 hypothetical protein JX266_006947 [Neoarthrinium moseri]KAI1874215.1 hypothetical protein JN550_002794 [Neoarthrinium moseri]
MDAKAPPALNFPPDEDLPSYPPPSYNAAHVPAEEKAFDAASIGSAASHTSGFNPTIHLAIETLGFNLNSVTCRNWNGDQAIPVFRTHAGATPDLPFKHAEQPEYVSIRPKKNSNSCALVRGDDPAQTPLISTVYRWGPGRDPHMRIYEPTERISVADAVDKDKHIANEFEVKTHWITSRAATMVTPFGTFEWRYGKKPEKKEYAADSLLVCDRLDSPNAPIAGTSSSPKKDSRIRVAQLVRNEEYRAYGSKKRWVGGNGGRLMLDLGDWACLEKSGAVEKVEALLVAGCLLMLKRETDREKDNQLAVLT